MKLKVKYDDLYEIGGYISQKSEEIKTIYENIDSLIKSIPNYWQGDDSIEFISNFNNYLKSEKSREIKIENLGILLKSVSKEYQNKDEEWGKEMKKENDEVETGDIHDAF